MEQTKKLKLNCEFKRAYYKGKYKAGGLVVTYCLKGKRETKRIGITVGKKIGKAVARNRARRLIFAAYTQLEHTIPQGYDFVFVARERIVDAKMQQVKKELQKQIAFLCKLKPN